MNQHLATMMIDRRGSLPNGQGGIAAASATSKMNLTDAERAGLIAIIVIFTFLATLAVALRYFTIWVRRRPIGADDWTMAVAFLCTIAFTISTTMDVELLDPPAITVAWLKRLLKLAAVDQITSNAAIFTVKLSILFLYLRISRSVRNFLWWGAWSAIALISVQFISTVVVWCVQCIPLEKSWKPWVAGHCIEVYSWWLSFNGFHIFSDVLVLVLPMWTFWKLEAPLQKRIGVVCLFGVGCIPVIAGCFRMKSLLDLVHARGSPWHAALQVGTWGFIELDLGIVCACVPTIKMLFTTPKDIPRHEASPRTSEKPSVQKMSGNSRTKFSKYHITSVGDTIDEGDIELVQHRNSGGAESAAESQKTLATISTVAPLPTAARPTRAPMSGTQQRHTSNTSMSRTPPSRSRGNSLQSLRRKFSCSSSPRRPSQTRSHIAPVLRPEPEDYSAEISRGHSRSGQPEYDPNAIMVHTSFLVNDNSRASDEARFWRR
ncbi:integral membrane protein [Teratosphaeria destructans]|uniref:Integral membrane protein n=1 Tax=Teratosphaeria destructans TaxID=418781 RepID=A0A9W7SUD4_9PEZI|nr:integral membrane protein [Teratosphaeria destructans]